MRQIVRSVSAAVFVGAAAMARGIETNAAAVVSAAAVRDFAGCRIEVAGVYTQAELRVADWSGVSVRSGGTQMATAPEPGVDRSRGGGASLLTPLQPGLGPIPEMPEREATDPGDARSTGLSGLGAGPSRGAAGGASPGRWGWLAESVQRERDRQRSERSHRSASVFSPGADPFDSSFLSRGAFGESPLLQGDMLTPAAPLTPSAYRNDDANDGVR
jgi:hypothetical protein